MKQFNLTFTLSVLVITVFTTETFTQVTTRVLGDDLQFDHFMPYPVDDDIIYYLQPDINFEAEVELDRRNSRPLKRFAVKVETDYNVHDGLWTDYGGFITWQIGFEALRARSLNFHFTNIMLPENAELYIFSKDKKILHGPIRAPHIYNRVYASDIIDSRQVIIYVKMHRDKTKDFDITVSAVNQGIPPMSVSSFRGFGDANPCNYDVNCAEGAGWEDERDAVSSILRDGEDWCSGSLINTECSNMTPYYLTAFHCLDINNDGEISGDELNLNLYVFRFKYEAATTNCPGQSSGTGQGSWITYNGATYRAGMSRPYLWTFPHTNRTDFALLELNAPILDQPNLAVAGWNRNTNPDLNQTVTCIHHARGDAKKISIDSTGPVVDTSANFWIVNAWDIGLVEHSSSGSPLFDEDHRIIGQLRGGIENIGCDEDSSFVDVNTFGRFHLSWVGGGTNATRLSNWLAGGGSPPMTVNTMLVPYITPGVAGGANNVCNSNKTFELHNPIPGSSVSWEVTNQGLFATTDGAATSGSGTSAVLRIANPAQAGASSILTFTMDIEDCDPLTIERELWVGKPAIPTTSPSGTSPVSLGVGSFTYVSLVTAHGSSYHEWSASGAATLPGTNYDESAQFWGDYAGTGYWQIKVFNECGENTNSGQFDVTEPCDPCPRMRMNNPARGELIVEIPEEMAPIVHGVPEAVTGQFLLLDQQGRPIISEPFSGYTHRVDVSQVHLGLYFVRMRIGNTILTEKVVIIR